MCTELQHLKLPQASHDPAWSGEPRGAGVAMTILHRSLAFYRAHGFLVDAARCERRLAAILAASA